MQGIIAQDFHPELSRRSAFHSKTLINALKAAEALIEDCRDDA
jgi:hypothetical protein